MFKAIKHLLPLGRAWVVTTDKYLRRFFQGLGSFYGDIRQYIDDVYGDVFPSTTRAPGS